MNGDRLVSTAGPAATRGDFSGAVAAIVFDLLRLPESFDLESSCLPLFFFFFFA